ncbi:pilin [Xylella taiwanensis]|uniref:Ferrous iron transporter B n=1 Tax=Xylella taiwanensis TaxID=1444770 RepID=Z9JES0_9GAMM|nr:pilin [Xylella taiwanensis]AXI82893.1 ferrous iron transporter B [Xylella taiwanensis]AXI83011.1 ferrous iron transporter B [Xylella taiwanensis]AXI83404.1 ferrous iron transporter B [Xylella taiwanensis]EWS76900.1 ferrous iron transporter B [Xylella taiwanensis]MCD8455909.1 pilin [Xylella taiwanensis]
MKKQQGFHLIELMMVLAIISILAGTSVPMYQHYVAKSQVTAALADITPGKINTEIRMAHGMPRTRLANDIDLRAVTTHCHRIDVIVEVAITQSYTDPDGHPRVGSVSAPDSSITCTIHGNAQVNNKIIQWIRISDAHNAKFDDAGNGFDGQWFCVTNVDEAFRPIRCKASLPAMNSWA